MFKGLGNLGDMGKMMKAAQDFQTKLPEFQASLASITVEGEAGAGLVKATATATGELTGLTIDPSIFSAEEKEVAEDLILAAIKDAQIKAAHRHKEEMARFTEEMGLPAGIGDMKMPF